VVLNTLYVLAAAAAECCKIAPGAARQVRPREA
jgi:hypothetical protein